MLTKAELIEVMEMYVKPLYEIIGGIAAFIVISLAAYLVLGRFMRRL